MNENSRWAWSLVSRIAVHALVGALTCALLGAILIAASGALIGLILDHFEMAQVGALIGAVLGGGGAAIIGTLSLGIVGFLSAPRRYYLPPKSVVVPIILGMILATLGVMTSFFVLCASIAALYKSSFPAIVGQGLFYIMFAAPIVMLFGLVAGATLGFRREKFTAQRFALEL